MRLLNEYARQCERAYALLNAHSFTPLFMQFSRVRVLIIVTSNLTSRSIQERAIAPVG